LEIIQSSLFEIHSELKGLYPENNGIVGNTFYDPYYNTYVDLLSGENNLEEKWWNQSEPVWITAKKQVIKFAAIINQFYFLFHI